MRLVLVELEKLRTVRSTWLLVGLAIFSPLPIALLALIYSQRLEGLPTDVLGLVALPAALVASLGAIACAREFEHRTITTSFTLEPRRERIIVAKAAATAIVGIAVAVLATALALSLTAIWLSASDVAWPWTAGQTAGGFLGAVAVVIAAAVLGTAFGGIARHVGAAITLLTCIFIVAESILAARLPAYRDYGYAASAIALVEPGRSHAYGFLPALGVLWGATLAYLALGIEVVRRSDV